MRVNRYLKVFLGILAVAGIVGAVSGNGQTPQASTTTLATQSTVEPTTAPTDTPTPIIAASPVPVANPDTSLSNNNYYTNVDGATVHSPADSTNSEVPAGATARCGDGTYSFSQHRSGTCSYHGGVAEWL